MPNAAAEIFSNPHLMLDELLEHNIARSVSSVGSMGNPNSELRRIVFYDGGDTNVSLIQGSFVNPVPQNAGITITPPATTNKSFGPRTIATLGLAAMAPAMPAMSQILNQPAVYSFVPITEAATGYVLKTGTTNVWAGALVEQIRSQKGERQSAFQVDTQSGLSAKIIDLIIAQRSLIPLEDAAAQVADAALADAFSLLEGNELTSFPSIELADDGILTLSWERNKYGVALIFAGEGDVALVFARPDLRYTENGIHVAAADSLPEKFWQAIEKIIA